MPNQGYPEETNPEGQIRRSHLKDQINSGIDIRRPPASLRGDRPISQTLDGALALNAGLNPQKIEKQITLKKVAIKAAKKAHKKMNKILFYLYVLLLVPILNT